MVAFNWSKVDATGGMDACWPWLGVVDRGGYGHQGDSIAHRRVFEEAVGPIPPGMTVDHICFTKLCCNPLHLRLLTNVENARRQRSALRATCSHGHLLDEANTYLRRSGGRRQCRACNAAAARRLRSRAVA